MRKRVPNPRHSGRPTPHKFPAKNPAPPRPATAGTTTHWADVADWYDTLVGDDGSEYHREVIIPGILRMLGVSAKIERLMTTFENRVPKSEHQTSNIKNSLDILDLACGQGVLCRKLAAAGCRVTGIDAAEPLILAARRRNDAEKLPIDYRVADATKLLIDGNLAPGLAAGTFDAITIILAIQNITPLSPVWQACRALLKPGGSLILVMMHPAFRIPRQSDWLWEEKTATQARVIRQYLSSTQIDIQTHPGLAAHGKNAATTTHFHRPLQAYINTLGNAGLLIDHIEEWVSHKSSEAGPKKAALDRARKEIPMFLAIRARRV